MDTILPLTPSPVILIKNLENLWNWNEIDDLVKQQQWTNDGNYQISPKSFLENLPNHKEILENEVKEFIKNTSYIHFNFDIKLTSSWVNKMRLGESHPWHSHPFSIISGVIFLNDHPENWNLTFKRDVDFIVPPYSLIETDFIIPLRELLQDNPVENNLKHHLVLFNSNTSHCVPAIQTPNAERKTLSFNTFWKGKVDFGTDLNSFDFGNG